MKAGGKIVIGIFGFLLLVSIIVAQTAYRIERTALSYTYMANQLERIVTPLSDPEIQGRAATGVLNYLRNERLLDLPARIQPSIREAAMTGFDADWFLLTGKRMLFNTQRFLDGQEKELSLPVSFDSFKLALMDIVRREFDTGEYLRIDREVSQIDSSIDIGPLLLENDIPGLTKTIENRDLIFVCFIYVLPCVLFVLCFATRRAGHGLFVSGIGLLAGGGCIAITSLTLRNLVSQSILSVIARALPSFLDWVAEGVSALTGEVMAGFLPLSIIITGIGLVFAAAGVVLVSKKNDLPIKTPRSH